MSSPCTPHGATAELSNLHRSKLAVVLRPPRDLTAPARQGLVVYQRSPTPQSPLISCTLLLLLILLLPLELRLPTTLACCCRIQHLRSLPYTAAFQRDNATIFSATTEEGYHNSWTLTHITHNDFDVSAFLLTWSAIGVSQVAQPPFQDCDSINRDSVSSTLIVAPSAKHPPLTSLPLSYRQSSTRPQHALHLFYPTLLP